MYATLPTRSRQTLVMTMMGAFVAPVVALPPVPATLSTSASTVRTGREAAVKPHAGMIHFPDVSATHVVFSYANDLWLVSREGGTAVPLASPPGREAFPKFSPDGRTIAFAGNYDGNTDIYTALIDGGVPHRVTHHPDNEVLCDWTPNGKLLFYANDYASMNRQDQLFVVAPDGGLPKALPIRYGADGAISPDGTTVAFLQWSRDFRTWKRYRGGTATDVWLFNLRDHSAEKITDWEGTDTLPMWHGQTVYYLSDGGSNHRLNIWSYDTGNGRRSQVTDFEEYDVKWPSMGPGPRGDGEIVFQCGPEMYLLDLATGEPRAVNISIPGARPTLRPVTVDAGKNITSRNISSTGKRVVVAARGDLWTLPAKNGARRNLTRSVDSAERNPSWSPDGQWIAYFCDKSGEYELYVTQSDGKGETRKLTDMGSGFRFNPRWSPDSKNIAMTDYSGTVFVHTIESGETKRIDRDEYANQPHISWAHDSNWLAYTKSNENRLWSIHLYNLDKDESYKVTSGTFWDTWPTFDREGKYLYFASQRDFSSPTYDDTGATFIYAQTDTLNIVPLREDLGSPFAPKSDEEKWGDEETEDEDEDADEGKDDDKDDDDSDDEGDEKKDEDPDPLIIDLDGFEERVIKLPIDSGAFFNVAVSHDNKLLYVRRDAQGTSTIHIFDATADDEKDRTEKTVMEGAGGFNMSADGKKLLLSKNGQIGVVDAAADQSLEDTISTDGLETTIDPRAEWRQIFTDGWRIFRDFFYDSNMHGVDWQGVHKRYAAMLDDCVCREDLNFVLGEMISELNCGHTYVSGRGDIERAPNRSVGMLGVDYELDDGAYRIARIYTGGPWDIDARGPLSQPGVDVNEGDYLLAVDGVPVDAGKDPWAAFQGLGGKTVTLTVSEEPEIDDASRDVVVTLLRGESNLRYREWVESNRRYVDEKTDGAVGYIHVPNTGVNGQNELFRQFYGQKHKAGLIVDERWNGGGQDPDRFVELLSRPAMSYRPSRYGRSVPTPSDSNQGHKCMLINGRAGSGGDLLPYYFRAAGVGKLIGTRTWGGVVGMSGNPGLVDGGYLAVPTVATYEVDGTWGMEGHGVEPDIEAVDDPGKLVNGEEPQLDAAIEHLLDLIRKEPYTAPAIPSYPDRSGMGVLAQDR